ncbi:MAG: 4-(cytidine 5'-diphospho)-2-C-methyl-D-erythritol kinase [Actinomycetota bacterium]
MSEHPAPPPADGPGAADGVDVVTVAAPAKLTLRLRLLPEVRADGLHTIDAEMVALDFGDDVTISPIDGPPRGASVVRYHGFDVPESPDGSDLVTRALDLAGRCARVSVHKRIPAGAGLGGGSSDAAAVLRWAGFGDRERAAFELGADVAFCLHGGRARVRGMGEIVEPLPFEPLTVTLATPPVHCSTAEVYRMWDRLGGPTADGPNDLEPAALAVAPELAGWREELRRSTGATPYLAGSGSTWYVLGDHPGPGRVVAHTIP